MLQSERRRWKLRLIIDHEVIDLPGYSSLYQPALLLPHSLRQHSLCSPTTSRLSLSLPRSLSLSLSPCFLSSPLPLPLPSLPLSLLLSTKKRKHSRTACTATTLSETFLLSFHEAVEKNNFCFPPLRTGRVGLLKAGDHLRCFSIDETTISLPRWYSPPPLVRVETRFKVNTNYFVSRIRLRAYVIDENTTSRFTRDAGKRGGRGGEERTRFTIFPRILLHYSLPSAGERKTRVRRRLGRRRSWRRLIFRDRSRFPVLSPSSLSLALPLSLSPPLPSPPQSKREGRSPASDCRVSPSVVASNLADDRRGHPTGARACAAESTLAATLGWAAVILASRVYIPCYATRLPICPSPTLRWEAPPPSSYFSLSYTVRQMGWGERERGRVCERARVLGDGVASPRQPCVRSDSLPPRVSLRGVSTFSLFFPLSSLFRFRDREGCSFSRIIESTRLTIIRRVD